MMTGHGGVVADDPELTTPRFVNFTSVTLLSQKKKRSEDGAFGVVRNLTLKLVHYILSEDGVRHRSNNPLCTFDIFCKTKSKKKTFSMSIHIHIRVNQLYVR